MLKLLCFVVKTLAEFLSISGRATMSDRITLTSYSLANAVQTQYDDAWDVVKKLQHLKFLTLCSKNTVSQYTGLRKLESEAKDQGWMF